MEAREVRYSISEIFGSVIQGEGSQIGLPTHFIRFNGCDARCNWCDSLYAVLPEQIRMPGNNTLMTASEICQNLLKRPKAGMVTLSGGNPALIKNMSPLIEALREAEFKIALETQGSVYRGWFNVLDYLVLSPKPPSAGDWYRPAELKDILINTSSKVQVSLKVVVFDDRDIDFAASVHSQYPTTPFTVQCGTPQNNPSLEAMRDQYRCLVETLLADPRFADTRILPQLHVWCYGHKRGV